MFRSRHLLGCLSLLAGSLAGGVVPAVAGHPAGAPGHVPPVGPSTAAVNTSLPAAVNGIAPGPEILHRPPAHAPHDVQRARVTCGARLDVKSDGPLTVELLGCSGTRSVQSFGS